VLTLHEGVFNEFGSKVEGVFSVFEERIFETGDLAEPIKTVILY
jgi:hypothetical protein